MPVFKNEDNGNNELLYQSGCSIETLTSSAFIQQRSKISYKAFESLFHDFATMTRKDNVQLFKGYRLLAVDGSDTFICNSKRGLDTRISLKGALGEQGFHGGTRGATEWNQWIEAEKQ